MHLLRLALRQRITRRQRVTQDVVVLLRIQRVFIECDAGAAGGLLGHAVADALDDFGLAVAVLVLQRDDEAARGRRVEAEVHAAPGVHIDHTLGRYHHVARMADVVGEDRGAEARRQRKTTVVAWAGGNRFRYRGGRLAITAGTQ